MKDLKQFIELNLPAIEQEMVMLVQQITGPEHLKESMQYSLKAGGKRIRPLFVTAVCEMYNKAIKPSYTVGSAVEMIHTYSLIHDDLPAMDNDRERRGKPTVWVKFGEANAILAGDALLALAYQVAANAPRNVAAIVDVLGEKGVGVVRGQVEDIRRNNRIIELSNNRIEDVDFIYRHKTADLFIAAAAMGGLAGGGSEADVAALKEFALNLGLAFQYEDDLLDGDSPYSREKTEALVNETTAAAVAALGRLPGDVTFLRELAQKLVGRTV